MKAFLPLGICLGLAVACGDEGPAVDEENMSFFATSEGSGANGGDLGGLSGADATCQRLAEAAGSTKTWRAYLCSSTEDARDRIGTGPWSNALGDAVASDVDALHSAGLPNTEPNLVYTEKGKLVPSREHDILTGCNADGTLRSADETCSDWTSSDDADRSYVGHSERPSPPNENRTSWNSEHESGCSENGLFVNSGSGRLYCFAVP